jgi:hypothetical protein
MKWKQYNQRHWHLYIPIVALLVYCNQYTHLLLIAMNQAIIIKNKIINQVLIYVMSPSYPLPQHHRPYGEYWHAMLKQSNSLATVYHYIVEY